MGDEIYMTPLGYRSPKYVYVGQQTLEDGDVIDAQHLKKGIQAYKEGTWVTLTGFDQDLVYAPYETRISLSDCTAD